MRNALSSQYLQDRRQMTRDVSPSPPIELQKPLGSYLDPTRLRFSLLANRHLQDAVTTLGSDTFRVNRIGKNGNGDARYPSA